MGELERAVMEHLWAVDGDANGRDGWRTVREVHVWRPRRGLDLGPDLATAAVAGVHVPGLPQRLDRRPVPIEALALPHDRTVPVETDRRQIVELSALVLG